MKKLYLFFLLVFLACSCGNRPQSTRFDSMSLLDREGALINAITDTAQLLELTQLVKTSEALQKLSAKPNWMYKIDIGSAQKSSRWLYDTTGIMAMNNYEQKPVFRIKNNRRFLDLLVKQNGPEPK